MTFSSIWFWWESGCWYSCRNFLHTDVVKHIKSVVCNLYTHCRLKSVALWNNEKEFVWGCMLASDFASSLVNNINVLRQILIIIPFSVADIVLVNLRIWVCVVTVGSGLEGIAVTVLLPLPKGLKMKPIAKLVICKLTVFACISVWLWEGGSPWSCTHLFSVSSWTLRSESFICVDGFSFGLFCTSFCKNPWLRLVCKSGLWVGTSVWLIVTPTRSKEYHIYVKGASPNCIVIFYWSVHMWGCLLLTSLWISAAELLPKKELGWFYSIWRDLGYSSFLSLYFCTQQLLR